MDSSATSNTENVDQRTTQADNENVPSMEKLEAMVTPEQVHSAAVARKRRTITRKRTNDLNKNRSQTPLRAPRDADETSSEYEEDQVKSEKRSRPIKPRSLSNERSQTPGKPTAEKQANEKVLLVTQVDKPETKDTETLDPPAGEILKKRQSLKLAEAPSDNETQDPVEEHKRHMQEEEETHVEKEPEIIEYPPEVVLRRSRSTRKTTDSASTSDRQSITSDSGRHERSSSIPRQLEEQIQKLDNFVTTNTQELMHFLHKAKTTVEEKGKELRRRKFKKTDDQKRSQSQPKQLTETDVLDSFRKAQKATAEREQKRLRSLSARRYSSASEKSPSPEPQRPLRKRVLVKDIIKDKQKTSTDGKKQPKLKDQIKCNKIVEVLDPHTSKVIAVKNVGEVAANMRVIDAMKIFKYYSPRQMFKEYRKYKVDMNEEYTRIRRLRRKCINHMIILLIFCGLGGIMFKFIEGHFENFYKCGVKRVKRDFIDLLWVKSHNMREEEWKSLARNRLRIFEEELHNAHEAGVHSYSGQRSWSFLNGIVYCLTVVTTIGYGHLYPTTKTGQALTIVYSLIGIPLFLIILTDFGKLFTRCIKFLWSFVRRLYYTGSCRKIRKTTHAQEIFKGAQMMYEIATFRRPSTIDPNMMPPPGASSPPDSIDGTTAPPTPAISNFEIDDEFNLPISLAILLLVLYIFLGAVLFGIWEGWDFFASFYFVFISMSTIGFGDYVPRHPIFMIVSIVYLVFGLALMSMCINVVQVKLSDTFNQASAKIGATIGLGVAADDGSIKPVPPQPIEMPHVHGSIVDLDKISFQRVLSTFLRVHSQAHPYEKQLTASRRAIVTTSKVLTLM